MKLDRWIKPDSLENFFSLPNQIYSLGLEAGRSLSTVTCAL